MRLRNSGREIVKHVGELAGRVSDRAHPSITRHEQEAVYKHDILGIS